jgi:hypothetical protein
MRDDDEGAVLLQQFAAYLDEHIVVPAVDRITAAIAAQAQARQTQQQRERERITEYIRDASVLVLIFVPVDLLIPRLLDKNSTLGIWLTTPSHVIEFTAGVIALSFAMLRGALWLERE